MFSAVDGSLLLMFPVHPCVRVSLRAGACVCVRVCPCFCVIGLCVALNSVVEEKESYCFAHCIFAFMLYVLVSGGGGEGTLIFSSYVGLGPASTVYPQNIS